MQNLEESGPYIWLRHSTQFQKDGQAHTVEMSVPVPIGASAERREALIREAEAGLTQMLQQVGQRPTLPRPQATGATTTGQSASPAAASVTRPPAQEVSERPAVTAIKTAVPASPRPAAATVQPSVPQAQGPTSGIVREARPEAPVRSEPAERREREEIVVPPSRPNIGASMPIALSPTLDSSGNLAVPEFIKYIRQNLNLDPREAMLMLGVKSLSTGINLRSALDRLKVIVAQQRNAGGPVPPADAGAPAGKGREELPDAVIPRQETRTMPPVAPPPPALPESPVPARGFDEEMEPDENELADDDLVGELEDEPDFSPQLLEQARTLISSLREHQGATVAHAKRLQALGNVIDTQIEEEQLQELVFGVWNISALKKLKTDQVEALISWAKQDDFIDEARAVLYLLEEDRYARGNR